MCYNITVRSTRPVGQAVKTLASHAGNSGSIPGWVTKKEATPKGVVFFFAITESNTLTRTENKNLPPNYQRVNRGRNIAPPLPSRKPCKAEQIPGWVTKKELNRKIRFSSFYTSRRLGMESMRLRIA